MNSIIENGLYNIFDAMNNFFGRTTDEVFKKLKITTDNIYISNNYSAFVLKNLFVDVNGEYEMDFENIINGLKLFEKNEPFIIKKSDKFFEFKNGDKKFNVLSYESSNTLFDYNSDLKPICSIQNKDLKKFIDNLSSVGMLDGESDVYISFNENNINGFGKTYLTVSYGELNNLEILNQCDVIINYDFARHLIKTLGYFEKEEYIDIFYNNNYLVFDIGNIVNIIYRKYYSNEQETYKKILELIKRVPENKVININTSLLKQYVSRLYKTNNGSYLGNKITLLNDELKLGIYKDDFSAELSIKINEQTNHVDIYDYNNVSLNKWIKNIGNKHLELGYLNFEFSRSLYIKNKEGYKYIII